MNFLMAAVCLSAAISVSIASPSHARSSKKHKSKLIVISLDALMFSQINEADMPVISNFYKNGVHCPEVQPVFPTKTLTNHFSIATGLYAGSHGVTGNIIYDNVNKKNVSYSKELFTSRLNITPIWTLNELAGKRSAVSMWASSEFEFRGKTPTYAEKYVPKAPWKPRLDNIIPLLKREEDPINFVMFYSEQPDSTDHEFSPDSPQVTESLKDMDNMMKYLTQQLEQEGLSHNTDVIIVSDHGMDTVAVNQKFLIDLADVVSNSSCKMYGDSAVIQVIANDRYDIKDICNVLKNYARKNKHFKAYMNSDLPNRWHVSNEQFFGPCTLVADPGYAFENIWTYFHLFPGFRVGNKYGYHGYDNIEPSMQAIFLANGPRFKNNVKIPFMELVDYYHLFARLLGIEGLTQDLKLDGVDRRNIWKQMLKYS